MKMMVRPNTLNALLLGVAAFAAVSAARAAEAQITVKERTVDLGRLAEGDKGTAKFVIENHGDGDLHIDRVFSTCGCTVPKRLSEDDKLLRPGESLEVEAVFDSRGRRGKQRKTVTVASDDPAEPTLKLFLTAEVVALFEIMVKDRHKMRLSFGTKKPGEEIADTIDVLPTEPGKTLEIVSVDIRHAALFYETEPITKDDRVGVRVKLRVDPDASIGQVSTSLLVSATVDADKATSSLALSGDIVGVLTYKPNVIKRMQPALPGNFLAPVSVAADKRHPFEILSAEAGPNLDATIERETPLRYAIKLRVKESAPPGPFGCFLDIKTTVMEQPLIRIPIYAAVRPWVTVEPPVVVLPPGKAGDSGRLVRIASSANEALELGEITVESPYITAEPAETPGRASKTLKHLRIKVSKSAPPGTHSATVRVGTNIEAEREVTIPVTLIVQ